MSTKTSNSRFRFLSRSLHGGVYAKPILLIALSIVYNYSNAQDWFSNNKPCYTPDVSSSVYGNSRKDLSLYIPNDSTPIMTIRLTFHVLQREPNLPKGNFDENDQGDVTYLNDLFNRLNDLYSNSNIQWCNCSWQGDLEQTRDTKIRFVLNGIYYHRDNIGYVNYDGSEDHTYNYDHYGICKEEVLNIFFSQPPINGPSAVSIYPDFIGMFNFYDEYIQGGEDPWSARNLLGHEIGHMLGLSHSFLSGGIGILSDMCQFETTDGNSNFCETPELDCGCGNNMMSFSRFADYISPLQMATMRRSLTLDENVSKYLQSEHHQCNTDFPLNSNDPSEPSLFSFLLTPNPAMSEVVVSLSEDHFQSLDKLTIHILDLTGRVWSSSHITGSRQYFEVSTLPTGVYIVALESNERTIGIQKLVKW